MNKERLTYLYSLYQSGILTDEERIEWQALIEDPKLDEDLKEIIGNQWYDYSNEELVKMDVAKADRLVNYITDQPQENSKVRKAWPLFAKVASVILLLGAGLYYYTNKPVKKIENVVAYANDIAPGGNKAFITLANGKQVVLSDAANGELANEGNTTIRKTADGQVVYEDKASQTTVSAYNTITTPKGGEYTLTLSDGTKVILNAASTLKYPTSFGKERNVELTGEAYFQVAHNKAKPFKVISTGQKVEVLGTHFNVNTYADEKNVRTTLLEGSVRLNDKTTLKPGEQASLSQSGKISVEQVNVDDVIAWTNGKFIFDSESIESIMRKLSRWYDVEVVYEGDVRNKEFAGIISRKDNISKILDKITLTQAAHFKIEGRRVTVMP